MRHLRSIFVMIVAFLTLFPSPGMAASIRVSWSANTDTDLAGYKVYYGTQSNTYGTPANVTSGTSYDITSVQTGTTYYMAVSAFDTSGNESAKSTEKSITVPVTDTTPPTGTVVINSGAASTTSASVTLTLSATDTGGTVTGMKFSNDGSTYSSEVSYATSYSWTLSSGYGTKTVYAKFKDNSGNWSSAVSDTIAYIDATPPTGSVVINSGAASTSTTAVTLTLSASDNSGSVTGMKFSNDGATYSSEVSYATSYSWTLSSGIGTKTVSVLFKDSSGNWMTSPATDTIQLVSPSDTTPPTGSILINSGATTSSSTSVTLTLAASDTAGSVTGMKFSNDGTTWSSEVSYTTSYSWTLSSGYGTKTVYALFKDNSGNWMTSPATDTIQYASSCPVANAGSAQNVAPQRVILDGSASYDPGGGTLQYGWSQVSGTQVIIETPTASTASFMGIKAGAYRFKLTCTNGACTNTSTVDVTIQNIAPSVNAGSDRTIDAGTPITLHATGQDPNEDSLTYQWTKVSGPSVSIPSMAQQDITFTPTTAGQYIFSVQCYDGVNYSAASQVNVTVNAVNHVPTANAGPNQDVNMGSTVTLNGTGSTDPDGDSLSYSWVQASGPVQVTLNGASTAQPTFVANTVGTYQLSLTVNDGKVNSTPSRVTIRILAQNNAPVANAGPDMHAYVGDDVVLNASSSYDPDLDPITFSWSQVSGASVVIFNANTQEPFFTPTTSGVFEFKVTLSDGQATATDNVIVTVDNHNQVPIADAGADIAALVNDTVTLDGSMSYDLDETTISYIWSQTSGPVVSLNSSNSVNPSFMPTLAGVYVFELQVYDGIDTSSPVSITVTVQDRALEVTLISPAFNATVSQNPLLTWAGKGFSSYRVYMSINNSKKYTKIYNGSKTSCTMHPALWSWFIPSGTTITWYVEGNASTQVVKSSQGKFIKR